MVSRPLWLIVPQSRSGMEVLTVASNVLPVFSFEEEAEMFLNMEHAAYGWQVRKTAREELVSVLYGPCREVTHVALDPVPGILELVSLRREDFIRVLLSDLTPPAAVEKVGVMT